MGQGCSQGSACTIAKVVVGEAAEREREREREIVWERVRESE